MSTLVILKRFFDANFVSWERYRDMYEAERERVIAQLGRSGSSDGNYYNTQPLRLSRHYTRAVISSTYRGDTSDRDAFKLLGTRKHETFARLADEIGVA